MINKPRRRSSLLFIESLESRQLFSTPVYNSPSPLPHVSPAISATPAIPAPQATLTGTPDGSNPVTIPPADTTPATPDGTDFGLFDVSNTTTPISHTFTITNSGSDTLTLTGSSPVSITGANASDFTLTQPASSSLAPGDSTTFTLLFRPTTPGIRTATLSLATNDPNTPAYTFAVSGAAIDSSIASRILVTQAATIVPLNTTTPFSFGNLPLNSPQEFLVFTLTNVSAQTLTLDPVTLDPAAGFNSVVSLSSLSLTPGASATFTLGMTAAVSGPASATVNLTNIDAATNTPITSSFTLTGTVTIPQIAVLLDTTPLTAGQSIDFGSVVSGSTSTTKTFTIKNTGLAPLIISPITAPDGFGYEAGSGFVASTVNNVTTYSATIQPGQTATFTLTLGSASSVGSQAGQLTISTNDPVAPTFILALTGQITVPGVTLSLNGAPLSSGAAISVGTGVINQTGPSQTITITNSGAAPLNIGAPTIDDSTGAASTLFSVSTPTTPLAAGQSTTLVITLLTTTFGSVTGNTLTFTTNDPNNPSFSFSLSANVISQPLSLFVDGVASSSGQTLSLGPVPQSKTPISKTLTLRNDGMQTIALSSLSLSAGFTLTSKPTSFSLAPGTSTTFVISFTPLAAGPQSGVLQIPLTGSTQSTFTLGFTANVSRAAKKGLTVNSVSLTKIPPVLTGGSPAATNVATATVTLANHSPSPLTGSYKITLYASAALIPVPGVDKVIGTLSFSLNKLPVKAQLSRGIRLSFPLPPKDAAYNIIAVVTGPKADPLFNFARAPYTVRVEKPAAILGKGAKPAFPLSVVQGKSATQTFSVANTGNTSIIASLTASFFLSTDGTLSNATKVGQLSNLKINLKPKASQPLKATFTIPKTTPAATYTLLVVLKKVISPTANTFLNNGQLNAGKITVTAKP